MGRKALGAGSPQGCQGALGGATEMAHKSGWTLCCVVGERQEVRLRSGGSISGAWRTKPLGALGVSGRVDLRGLGCGLGRLQAVSQA